MRRLPVYILLDVSGSMRGEPIKSVQDGLNTMIGALRQNPNALETAYLSIITFGPTAQQPVPLTELIQFQIPKLEAEGVGTSLGAAIKLLCTKINTEVKKTTTDVKGDWKPIIFIMTDGEPTDDFDNEITEFKKLSTGIVVACAAGNDANTFVLKMITDNVVELASLDSQSVKSFFQWVSGSIGVSSQRIELGKVTCSLDELPPLPKEITKAVNLKKGSNNSCNPFNTFDRQRALNKDKFGNLDGNEFDLAKDGAFTGHQIAVLHLYTGEGFDFSLPEKALQEKGFTIHRWIDQPPSLSEFKAVLSKSCQLWVISSNVGKLNQGYFDAIKDFFNSGKGLYLLGDNWPFYVDINEISKQLFDVKMSGYSFAGKVVGKKTPDSKKGFVDHQITVGLDFLYEGVTVATFPKSNEVEPLIYASNGKIVTVIHDKNKKRAILDGGFTRLFINWDTAGTARYVKNAATWLVNYENNLK